MAMAMAMASGRSWGVLNPTDCMPWGTQSCRSSNLRAAESKSLRVSMRAEVPGENDDEVSSRVKERRALKDELSRRLEDTRGNLDEESLRLISSLESLNPLQDLNSVPHLYKGFFQGLRASFKNSGRKGEVQKEVGYTGAIVTLGRATFNVFKPASLDIVLDQTYNHVGCSSDEDYSLIIRFQVESRRNLEGLLINRARYSISGPKKMDVQFLSSVMRPSFPERDVDEWVELFKGDNPGIDESTGAIAANLPAAKGWLDYLYLDDELRITRGNRGGVSVVQRIEKPVVEI